MKAAIKRLLLAFKKDRRIGWHLLQMHLAEYNKSVKYREPKRHAHCD